MLEPRSEKSVCLQHDLSIIRAFIGLNRLNVVATHQQRYRLTGSTCAAMSDPWHIWTK